MNSELVFNLWALYDSASGTVYGLSGKAYNIAGTDKEKLDFLKVASGTDYVTVNRYRVPERFSISFPDGEIRHEVTYLSTINDPNAQLFEEVFKNIEAELPPLPDFSGQDVTNVTQTVPEDPLCVVTILYEDDVGNIRPIITDEDRAWIAQQQATFLGN
ncbi:hypothetical protein [Vreelandella massiliensis]|uniref:hypothetical protein n=1 Tax=Vreelandella massiliensis TaxID=1816686 RepID=UPI00096A8288|nr:hypothetical protein [Halomonas massiliensis]